MLSATTGLGIFPAPHSAKNITIFEIPETPPLSCTFNLKNTSAIQIFWRILLEQPGVHRHFYKKRLSCDSYLLYFCATYTELILSPYQITSRKFNSEVQPWFINIINMVWYIDSRPRLIAVWHFFSMVRQLSLVSGAMGLIWRLNKSMSQEFCTRLFDALKLGTVWFSAEPKAWLCINN